MSKRKVNKTETFKPSDKAKIIIEALMEKIPKSSIYNESVETGGMQLAADNLTSEQFKAMKEKLRALDASNGIFEK